jgi:hypothetical protein
MAEDWLSKLPSVRPCGKPLATDINQSAVKQWLCMGGVEVNRMLALGWPPEVMLALFNCKVEGRECEKK